MGKFQNRHHKQRHNREKQKMGKFKGQIMRTASEPAGPQVKYTGPISEKYDGFPAVPRRDNKPNVGITNLAKLQKPVIFSRLAYDKQNYLVAHCDKEISWFGLVTETEHMFHVEDIILFDQQVSGAQTEIKAEDIDKFFVALMEEHGEDVAINEYLPKLKLWGHSHVNMGVGPSGTDETTLKYMFRPEMDFFIRVIANKKGELKADLYRNFHCKELPDPLSFSWIDTAWDVAYVMAEPEQGLLQEMVNKVKNEVRQVYTSSGYTPTGHYTGGGYNPIGYRREAIGPGAEKKTSQQQTSTQTATGKPTALESKRDTLQPWEYIWWTHEYTFSDYFNRFLNGDSVAIAGPALLKEDEAA